MNKLIFCAVIGIFFHGFTYQCLFFWPFIATVIFPFILDLVDLFLAEFEEQIKVNLHNKTAEVT